jgi:hypothetical protein
MKRRMAVSILATLCIVSAAACSKSPTSANTSFGAPQASTPANGASITYASQPVTLTITNAIRAGSATATYSVEVATDSGFNNKVFTKDGIPEGSGGTTSVTLTSLNGGTTYYWHSAATIDSVKGAMSAARTFTVQPNVVISPPAAGFPGNGGTASDTRPIFTVQNATVTGPAGPIAYEFQVATDSSFQSILASSGPVPEQSGGSTSWQSTVDLGAGNYVWRARGTDPLNNVQGPYSDGATFTVVPFDMRRAVIWDNPADLGSWAETANITRVDLSTGRIVVDFDKRQGPGHWPDVGFGDGALEYTLGICLKINGTWNCSAVVQFWNGRDLEAGGDVGYLAQEWFYDNRWGAMKGYQPAPGETVGWFVAAGNLRDSGNVITKERSKVLLLPYGANYSSGASTSSLSVKKK